MLNFFQIKYFDVDTHEHLILEVYTSLVNVRGTLSTMRKILPSLQRVASFPRFGENNEQIKVIVGIRTIIFGIFGIQDYLHSKLSNNTSFVKDRQTHLFSLIEFYSHKDPSSILV